MRSSDHPPVPTEPEEGYERRDVNVKTLVLLGLSAIVIIIIVIFIVADHFTATKEKLVFQMVNSPQSAELRELRARESEVLGSYDLLDANAGQYRIPIDRAMKLMADEAFRRRAQR